MNKDELYDFVIKTANGGTNGLPLSKEEIIKLFGTDVASIDGKTCKITGAIFFTIPADSEN